MGVVYTTVVQTIEMKILHYMHNVVSINKKTGVTDTKKLYILSHIRRNIGQCTHCVLDVYLAYNFPTWTC